MSYLRSLQSLFPDGCLSPSEVRSIADDILAFVRSRPELSSYFDDLMKYRYRTPNRYFLQSLSELEADFDVRTLLRTIHQQDEDIAFLSHRLAGVESIVNKYEKLVRKVDWLKRQNKRLVSRNKELTSNVYKSEDNY